LKFPKQLLPSSKERTNTRSPTNFLKSMTTW